MKPPHVSRMSDGLFLFAVQGKKVYFSGIAVIFLFHVVVRLFLASVCDVVGLKIGRAAETVLWEAPVRHKAVRERRRVPRVTLTQHSDTPIKWCTGRVLVR